MLRDENKSPQNCPVERNRERFEGDKKKRDTQANEERCTNKVRGLDGSPYLFFSSFQRAASFVNVLPSLMRSLAEDWP